jgi:hypothetical protein
MENVLERPQEESFGWSGARLTSLLGRLVLANSRPILARADLAPELGRVQREIGVGESSLGSPATCGDPRMRRYGVRAWSKTFETLAPRRDFDTSFIWAWKKFTYRRR